MILADVLDKVMEKLKRLAIGKAVLDEFNLIMSNRCNLCKEQYVGIAQDCRCTNYGKPLPHEHKFSDWAEWEYVPVEGGGHTKFNLRVCACGVTEAFPDFNFNLATEAARKNVIEETMQMVREKTGYELWNEQ